MVRSPIARRVGVQKKGDNLLSPVDHASTSIHLNCEIVPTLQIVTGSPSSCDQLNAMSDAASNPVATNSQIMSLNSPVDFGWIAQVVMRWISFVFTLLLYMVSLQIQWSVTNHLQIVVLCLAVSSPRSDCSCLPCLVQALP